MPPPAQPNRPSLRDALRGGTLGVLTWAGAGWLGFLALAGLPLASLVPVAALVGAAAGMTRARWILEAAAGGLVAVILVVGFTPALPLLAPGLIDTSSGPAEPAAAVVVLSGAVSSEGLLSPAASDRLLRGVELLRAGAAPVLITTRIRIVSRGDTVTSDRDQARLRAFAPDSIRWVIVDSVRTTRDEAVRVAARAAREGWRHLIVVTSPLHTRRACAAFRRAGVGVTCASGLSRELAVRRLDSAGERLAVFGPWLYETVGGWWYRVRGWG